VTYKKNVPAWEQILRVLAGAGIAAYGILALLGAPLGYGLVVAGTALAITGLFGWCPMCAIGGRTVGGRRGARI
jgi:Protein of unknown function (DUF2892)